MWLLSLAIAVAQVPEGVVVDDPGPWQDGVDTLIAGPPGCWEVVGEASWSWAYGRFGLRRGEAVFAGRFDEGTWSELVVRSLGEVEQDKDGSTRTYAHDEALFQPAIGRSKGMRVSASWSPGGGGSMDVGVDQDAAPRNGLDALLHEIGGRVETAWTSWDVARDGVVLQRQVAVKDGGGEVRQTAFFPGGASLPTEVDTVAPGSVRFRGAKLQDAELRLRAKVHGGNAFPTAESHVFRVSALFGMVQIESRKSLTYRSWRACKVAAPPPQPVPTLAAPEPDPPKAEPAGPSVIEFDGSR